MIRDWQRSMIVGEKHAINERGVIETRGRKRC